MAIQRNLKVLNRSAQQMVLARRVGRPRGELWRIRLTFPVGLPGLPVRRLAGKGGASSA